MKYIVSLVFFFSFLLSQDDSTKIYWNSLSTAATVGVPIADDESLEGGRIQVKVSFDQGKNFNNLGDKFTIEGDDIDNLKEVSISQELFETSTGFAEGGIAQFIAQVWDRAGNSTTGSVSDSVLNIDQTLPESVSLVLTSSNTINPNMVMPGDSITFQFSTNENILAPLFIINGEEYENAVGLGKSWMFIYFSDEADDGPINFKVVYKDLAGNPGVIISEASDSKIITMDGTEPKLSEVTLLTSNEFDSTLAIKGDTVFLNFKSSEKVTDINISLNYTEAIIHKESELEFTYYHIFTENDSEGVIPIGVNYKDLAGNIGELVEETSNDSEVSYDMTPPAEFKVEKIGSIKSDAQKIDITDENQSASNNKRSKESLSTIMLGVIIVSGLTLFMVWISWYKIFSKAGQSGWKAFVPLLNIFTFTKIVDKPVWWSIIYIILPIGYILSALHISKAFDKKILFSVGLIILPFIFFPLLAFGKSSFSN
jgi:hypothetical protein